MSLLDRSSDWVRFTVLLDEGLEQWVIDQALARGAVSYICTYCSGKPPHAPFEDPRSGRGLVRMELLAPPAGTPGEDHPRSSSPGELLSFLQQLPGTHYPVTVVVDRVTVFTSCQPARTAAGFP